MARPLIPFVQNGYYASRNWIPLVKGNGFTTSGGGEQEEVWETASGSVVTFDAIAAPLRRLSVSVEPVQNLNGYDNPWPAGGGVNKFDGIFEQGGYDENTGENISASSSTRRTKNGVPVSASTEYYFFVSPSVSGNPSIMVCEYDGNGGFLGCFYKYAWAFSFATKSSTALVKFRIYNANISSDSFGNVSVNYPSSVTTYSPYSNICPISGWDSVNIWVQPTHDTTANPTATIQLGETVYGGTLDVVTGVLTVTMAMKDLGLLNWTKYDTAQGTLFRSGSIADSSMVFNSTNFICSNYATVQSSARANGTVSCAIAKSVDIIDNGYSDAASFKTAMSGVQLVYELATPFEITLTPEQISTLQGVNNVWSDAGNVTVEYRAQ